MIDKTEQRRRAQEMSQTLAAQGLQAPKLTYPVSQKVVPKAAPVPVARKHVDCAGKDLKVGDAVATSINGIVSVLVVGQVVRFTDSRVEIRVFTKSGGRQLVLKHGDAVAKV